jgi:hypothetical protein
MKMISQAMAYGQYFPVQNPSNPYELFNRIFFPSDAITIRPIETWSENNKKKSRVLHKHITQVTLDALHHYWPALYQASETERANLFFGVCPRYAPGDGYDYAWQIRTVRCLWSDLDHCTPEEAVQSCQRANLPEPSLIIVSGSGVHCYWILDCAFQIDDAPAPPRVEHQWAEINGKKVKIKYFHDEFGGRVNLTNPTTGKPIPSNVPALSPRALWVQDVMKGLAQAIGGDHTTDLARLLRIPGTLNRKDERNGRQPQPCYIWGGTFAHYPISTFAGFAEHSPDATQRKAVETIPLPVVVKSVSAKKQNELNAMLAASALAQPGERSEADFQLCCYAIEEGIAKDHVKNLVSSTGKFGECGESYFALTWGKAEQHVRAQLYAKITQADPTHAVNSGSIIHDPKQTSVDELMRQITDKFLESGRFYSRAGMLTMIRDDSFNAVGGSRELAGLLNSCAEFILVERKAQKYEPLPEKYGNTWINRHDQIAKLPEVKLFTRNPVYTPEFTLVKPGYNTESGIYYMGPKIEPGQGTETLERLLKEFCFLDRADYANYLGMLLTTVLMPCFIGAKPGVLFAGNQPGLGKTLLAQIIAILRDGKNTLTCSYTTNEEEFEKRLACRVKAGDTTIIIDNAKGKGGKSAQIESACLERCLTDADLSFRHLGFTAEIRAENSHIFCITANTPQVGPDLLTRCVPINLYLEGRPAKRKFSMADPEGFGKENRNRILGELLGMIELWKAAECPRIATETRYNKSDWGNIIGGILSANGCSGFLENTEEAAVEFDPVAQEFHDLVWYMLVHCGPQTGQYLPPASWAAVAEAQNLLVSQLTNGASDQSVRSKSMRMGAILSRFVGENFSFDVGQGQLLKVVLRKWESGNNKSYALEKVL